MGWKLILVGILLMVIVVLWGWRSMTGRGVKFVGLRPLTGSWKEMSSYLQGVGSYLLDGEEEVEVRSPSSQWDFSDIVGSHKRERIVRRVLETLTGKTFPSVRPDWLRNDRTGHCLEIDCYNEEMGLAVEVSGEQHYKYHNRSLHSNREEFLNQIYRDKKKKEIILERGIDFFVVPYNVKTMEIPNYVKRCLEELLL